MTQVMTDQMVINDRDLLPTEMIPPLGGSVELLTEDDDQESEEGEEEAEEEENTEATEETTQGQPTDETEEAEEVSDDEREDEEDDDEEDDDEEEDSAEPVLEEVTKVKRVELGGRDPMPGQYWSWVQSATHEAATELGFRLTRPSKTSTMHIMPDTTIRARVGFQTFIANQTDAMTYGWKEVSFRYRDYPEPESEAAIESVSQLKLHCYLIALLTYYVFC